MRKLIIVTALVVMNTIPTYAGQWSKVDNGWSYIKDDGYPIKEGWFRDTDGNSYNFTGGVTRTGWYGDYYFDNQSAALQTGWININGKWYFSDITGTKQTGWLFVNNNWYFTKSSGQIVTETAVTIGDSKYYFTSDGAMARNTWVADNTYFADESGKLVSSTYVGSTYLGKDGKARDTTSNKKRNILSKVYSDQEYNQLARDSAGRYEETCENLIELINAYRDDYNDNHVYNYSGDDDDYYDKYELPELEEDTVLTQAAALRAVELASQQRASGARPNGKQPGTVLGDDNTQYTESVAFGQTDYEECYDALKSNGTHTSYWRRKEYTRIGASLAYDANGKSYWVVIYSK